MINLLRRAYHRVFYDRWIQQRTMKNIVKAYSRRQKEFAAKVSGGLFNGDALLQRLTPKILGSTPIIRLGSFGDGGYYVPAEHLSFHKLVSLGVGSNVDFELDLALRGITSYLFDGTIENLPIPHPKLLLSKKMIGLAENDITIDQVLFESLNQFDPVYLSIDIEGAEWDALSSSSLSDENLSRIHWMVIELHEIQNVYLTTTEGHKTREVLGRLLDNLVPIYLAPNNSALPLRVGEKLLPPVVEVTLIRQDFINPNLPRQSMADNRCIDFLPIPTWPF